MFRRTRAPRPADVADGPRSRPERDAAAAVVLGFALLLLYGVAGHDPWTEPLALCFGDPATARVVDRDFSSSRRGRGLSYRVTYEYRAASGPVRKQEQVDAADYSRAVESETIDLRVLQIGGWHQSTMGHHWNWYLAIGLTVLFLWFTTRTIRGYFHRPRRAARPSLYRW